MSPTVLADQIVFADNPEPRCPLALCLDVSSSMQGEPINQLQEGLRQFKEQLLEDPLASRRVEVAVVTFASDVVVAQEFATVEEFRPPMLTASGSTSMGAGIENALDLIQARKAEYRAAGVAYYRPLLLLLSDGQPTDSVGTAARRIRDEEARRGVAAFAVGVQGADMRQLAEIFVRTPLKLTGLDFTGLFQWLSRSVQMIACSQPGDQLALPPIGWGTL